MSMVKQETVSERNVIPLLRFPGQFERSCDFNEALEK